MLLRTDRNDSTLRRRAGGLAASAALHAAAIGLAAWPARLLEPAAGEAPARQIVVTQVAAPRPGAAVEAPLGAAVDPRPHLEISGAEVDLDTLRARRDELFPFLTLDVSAMSAPAAAEGRDRHLSNPFGRPAAGPRRPPLLLTDREIQRIVDGAWSRRKRWQPFTRIARLLDAHDPDSGRAADVVKAYADQNLLQPYYDADVRDGRFWTMLGLAADHGAFIELVQRYVRDHPSTQVATELLFLLEELAQGSRDTLLMLIATDPDAALRQTAHAQPEAFAFAADVHGQYLDRLRAARLDTPAAIRARYDEVRLALLSAIVGQSPRGYRVSDARYLAGVILLEQNNLDGAETWWSDLDPAAGDLYASAGREVLRILRLPRAQRAAAAAGLLGAEHRRWLDFSEQRLRQFGHAVDSF
jgi:hypothetical protein